MNKQDYLSLKRYVLSLCRDDVIDLSNTVGLNEYDRELLLLFNKNESRISACVKLGCCETKYTKDLKRIMGKIFNHLKRTSKN